MQGAIRQSSSQPLFSRAPKTASGGKIRAPWSVPGRAARNPLYPLGKTHLRSRTRVGAPILANTIGNLVADGVTSIDRNAHADHLLDKIAPDGATKEMRQQVKDLLRGGVSDTDIAAYYGQGMDKGTALVSNAVYRTIDGVPVDQNGNPTGDQFLLTGGATGPGARIMALEGKIANLSSGSALSIADAGELARLKGIDPTKPLYVGGGGEEGTGLTTIVRDYAGGKGNFAAWTQDNYIRDYIEITNALDLPRVLIGHSYGGDAVFDGAAYAAGRGIDVSLLATIDPVDGFHNHTSAQAAWLDRKLGGLWVDVRATRYETNPNWRGDFWASRGGRMDTAAQSQADVYLPMNVHHDDFGSMMRGAQVEQMVSGVYNNWRRK